MKMNQNLSWKFLLPSGIVLWFLFSAVDIGAVGNLLGILGQVLALFGIIDLCRGFFKRK